MRRVRQRFTVPPVIDAVAEVEQGWEEIKKGIDLPAGAEVAVGVGSRGIANLAPVVKAVTAKLKEAGLSPFITPAMGSHGGARAQGQVEVLAARGITEEAVGVPIRATMEVIPLGETEGIPLFLDRLAHEAAGIVLINRIKPHTNFVGRTESGILKMMGIGLGNQIGAEHYHRLSVVRDQYEILSKAGRELIKKTNFLFGVGLVENQDHRTAYLEMAPAAGVEEMEAGLLEKARECLPTLPLEEIDLLIVDWMGKDISGEGIDPNVVGRDVCAYGARRPSPMISRIFVRGLTEASEGSAVGIGQADFTTRRLVDRIDFQATAINCRTACCPEAGMIPLTYETDQEALAAALMSIRPYTLEDLKLVRIRSTLELSELLVSEGCLGELAGREGVEVEGGWSELALDGRGNLEPV